MTKEIKNWQDGFNYVAKVINPQTKPPTPIGTYQGQVADLADKLEKKAGGYPYKIRTVFTKPERGGFRFVDKVKIKGKGDTRYTEIPSWNHRGIYGDD